MLRRRFLKVSSITLGGLITLSHLPSLAFETNSGKTPEKHNRVYHLHGDARSGCASPPELAGLLENGISNIPPGWNG
jgi:hypothetical protein